MIDFSQALLDKIDTIVEKWIEAVRSDEQMESAKELTYKAVLNSLPIILQAIATMLSQTQNSDLHTLVEKSLEHGTLRAQQGYDAEEIAREYRILRWVMFAALEPDLLQGSPTEVIRAYRLIDTALDEVLARCFNSYTQERLREFQELQNQLRLTNQELTRLVRASQDNLCQLAHDLKTPLTSIIGYADLFLRQQQNSEMKDSLPNLGHIDKVLRSGRQLLRQINDALEISRYDAGKMKLKLTQTQVREVINSVIDMVDPLARSKNLQLFVDYDRAPEQVMTDSLRLQEIITNLLSNAIRYTQAGSITIQCEQQSDRYWSIQIADTGIGIAAEDKEQIFKPYFQANQNQAYIADSTGLGLAIVKRLVNLLQGKIEVVSQLGVGSSFTVIFPLEVTSALTSDAASIDEQ